MGDETTMLASSSSSGDDGFVEDDDWDRTLAEINLNIFPEDLKPKEPTSGKRYKIRDVPIDFPYIAYKSQHQMMQKIIEGVKTGENCLLESPTGTGKTAALLCALLGWQRHCYNTNDNCRSIIDASVEKIGGCTCGFSKSEDTNVTFGKNKFGKLFLIGTTVTQKTPTTPGASDRVDPSTSTSKPTIPITSPFKPPPSRNCTPIKMEVESPPPNKSWTRDVSPMGSPVKQLASTSSSCPLTPVKLTTLDALSATNKSPPKKLKVEPPESPTTSSTAQTESVSEKRQLDGVCAYCTRKYLFDNSRPPKIYYATRTHSQITQVVKQLKNTAYNKVKMTILASREVTCIFEKLQEAHKADERNQPTTNTQQEKEQQEEKITMDDSCRMMVKNYYRREQMKKKYLEDGGLLEDWNREGDDDNQESLATNVHGNDDESQESQITNGHGNEASSRRKRRPPKPILPAPVCDFFRPPKVLEEYFSDFQQQGAWDIEDIKAEGRSCNGCPYYGSRALHEKADIIFCSYNYLIFPSLREVADIKYVNNVIVFDEAHNIEDICRSAFSFSIEVRVLDESIRRLVDNLIYNIHTSGKEASVSPSKMRGLLKLSKTLQDWSTWIKNRGMQIKARSAIKEIEVHECFESEKFHEALSEAGMTAKIVQECIDLVEAINSDNDNDGGEEDYYNDAFGRRRPVRIPSVLVQFFKSFHQSLSYLFEEEVNGIGGIQDFKGYLTRAPKPKSSSQTQSEQQQMLGRRSRGRVSATPAEEKKPEDEFTFTFKIICLNPAIGFRVLRDCAFSIIVASGTLTPLNSFASELATKFAVTLQADHVIPKESVWTGVVSVGPRNTPLKLVKRFQDDPDIQDEIGDIILQVCNIVPNGVLVFLPSYPLMIKLQQRWSQRRGFSPPILDQISRKKLIFFEQSKNKADFKRDMQNYAEKVKGGYHLNGCILFAVFRGKVSEGIDFADEQARAVITVGIPFSNLGAVEIVSKKEYNDRRKKKQKPGTGELILSGSEWYTIQAYRAMNQGFGRCVRHCNDWGALILIDNRLGKSKYISGWVNNSLNVYNHFGKLKEKLSEFITDRQRNGRRQITIDYEPEEEEDEDNDDYNALETTEIVSSIDSSALTQVITSTNINGNGYHHHISTENVPTQRINMNMSISSDVGNIPESSPEYSFSDETQFVLETTSTQMSISQSTAHVSIHDDDDERENSNASSSSLFERSLMGGEVRENSSSNDSSDYEMYKVADILQRTADESEVNLNQSDIMDVSMPSDRGGLSEHEISQASSISYNSD